MARFTKYKKKNGESCWQFKGYVGIDDFTGKPKHIMRRGFKSQKEAKDTFEKLKHEYKSGELMTNKVTFQQAYDSWFKRYQKKVQESTWVKTREMMERHVLPIFGNKKINKIKPLMCQNAVDQWGQSIPSKWNKLKNFTKAVFELCIVNGWLVSNPITAVSSPILKPKATDELKYEFYTREEFNSFLIEAKRKGHIHGYVFFHLLGYTGLRKGEALALSWDDIDFDKKILTINKALVRGDKRVLKIQPPKTKKSHRSISIDDDTIKILKKWKAGLIERCLSSGESWKNTTLVFPNTEGNFLQLTMPRKWFLQILKDTELPKIKIHGFRHTHCTILCEMNVPIKVIQERLGHSDYKLTMNVYAHATPKNKDKVSAEFSEYMKEAL